MNKRPFILKSILISILIGFVFLSAQAQQPMTLIDLLEVPYLDDPQLSADGQQVLYRLAESDWKENKQIAHIWRINSDGTDAIKLTNGATSESSARWSPDGQWIAFLAKRGSDKAKQIYLISNKGGEAQQLSDHETDISDITWSPDGYLIYFLAKDADSKEEKERKEAKDDVFPFDEDYKQQHLWKISVLEKTEERITEGDFTVNSYTLSRDGQSITFHRAPTPLFDNTDEAEVWIMSSTGENTRQLTQNTVGEAFAQLSPDNSRVLFVAASNKEFEPYYNENLFLVPASGGDAELIFPEFPYEIHNASWGQDNHSIFLIANMGVHSELFQVNLKDKTYKQVTNGEHTLRRWMYQPKTGQHIVSRELSYNPGDLWTLSLKNNFELTRVTHVFEYLAKDFLLPKQERISWKGKDSVTVEGLLIYPVNYVKGQSYPLVVQTHGGPASSDRFGFGTSFARYLPVLAAHGYAIFKPNYRGSTGYGNTFLRDMVGHYYKNAHLDVMTGVDYLIKKGIADPERMVKMGWSAGGHMTNKIITFTDRFKAASSGAGAVNWISMYGQSDVRIYRTPWFGGTPWQKNAPIKAYWDHSPLKDIANVKTPTLIFVGENDVRVPPPQSVELYRALKTNGVASHLYIAPREPHGFKELRHRLFKMNAELEWFTKYALSEKYEFEKAPEEENKEDKE